MEFFKLEYKCSKSSKNSQWPQVEAWVKRRDGENFLSFSPWWRRLQEGKASSL